jgi:hypothetical protein
MAQVGVHDHGEFVGRAKAGCALDRADDDRAGVGAERLPGRGALGGVIDVADRTCVLLGPESFDLVEGEFRAGGDDQIVVGDRFAVRQGDAVLRRHHLLGRGMDEIHLVARQYGSQVDRDLLFGAPFHRHPGIGRGELEEGRLGDDRHLVSTVEVGTQVIGSRYAADAAAENDDMRHDFAISLVSYSTYIQFFACIGSPTASPGKKSRPSSG